MTFADQSIIRHKILNAIRLLEVDRMELKPNDVIGFEYKGCQVDVMITVSEKKQNHINKKMSEMSDTKDANRVFG